MKKIFLPILLVLFLSNILRPQSQEIKDSLLFESVKISNLEKTKSFIEQGANVNAIDKDGGTVLMWAAYKSDLGMVKYLVEKGADYKKKGIIWTKGGWYGSLLAITSGEKKLNMLKYFIEECKIDINDPEYNPEVKKDSAGTALEYANDEGNFEIIHYLLYNGANTDLDTYMANGIEDIVLSKISDNPKLIYEKNEKGEDLLFQAIYRNANKVVRKILEADIDINEKDNEGNSLLLKSIFVNNKEAAIMLIEKGADINSKNYDGTTVYLQAKRRGYEDIVNLLIEKGVQTNTPDGLKPELVVQMGHGEFIWSMDISSDGKYLVSGGNDGIILWEVKTGMELKKYNESNIEDVKFINNNKTIFNKSIRGCSLLELETGKKIRTLSYSHSYNLSSDEKFIIYGGNDLKIRELMTGKDMGIYFKGESEDHSLCFLSLSEQNILTLTYDSIYVLTLRNRENNKILWENKNIFDLSRIIPSPDKNIIVYYGYTDSSYNILDAEKGTEIKKVFGKPGRMSCIFSPDGKYFLYGSGNKVIVCDAKTMTEAREISGINGNVTSLIFTKDGKYLAIASDNSSINLWDFEKGECIQTFKSYCRKISDMRFQEKDNFTSISGNKLCKIDLSKGQISSREIGNLFEGNHISPDGKYIVSTKWRGNMIQLFKLDENKMYQIFEKDITLYDAVFSPDSKYFAVSTEENMIKIYDVKSLKEIKQFKNIENNTIISSMAFSPDMRYFAYGQGLASDGSWTFAQLSPKKVRIYEFETGKFFKEYNDSSIAIVSISFLEDGQRIAFSNRNIKVWDFINNSVELIDCDDRAFWLAPSPKSKYYFTWSVDNISIIDASSKKILKNIKINVVPYTIRFSPDNKLSLIGRNDGIIQIYDNEQQKEAAKIICIDTVNWAVISPDGHFDASQGSMKLMHYVVGTGDGIEYVDLEQLKERYYEPGLLQKLMGYNTESLRDVKKFNGVQLYPEVILIPPTGNEKYLKIKLADRGGGIGKVKVLINGKELTGNARGPEDDFNPDEKTINLKVDISKSPYLIPGKENKIEVFAFNSEGYLSSRGYETFYTPPGSTEILIPELYVVTIGISDYEDTKIRLRYAAKDAEDFAKAMKIGGTRLFGESKCHITILNTSGKEGIIQPLKNNIINTLESLKDVKQGDILVVYLSGHGINIGSGTDNEDFYYLTKEAHSGDLSDPEIRRVSSISSKELTELMLKIPALKQVLILDVCGSGKVIEKLTEKRDIPSSQVRVFERMKDRTGLHILSGCSSDAVSYETSKFAQGLLTYSLLMGMKGAALREQEFVDINTLFEFATNKVPELAKNVGGIQQPRIFGKESFDIGQILSGDKENIPLSKERPLILQSNFQDIKKFIDHLGLTKKVNDALREISSKGQEAKLIYLDASEFPDAYFLAGQYSVEENGNIKVQAKIFLGEKETGNFIFTGNKEKIDDLVGEIINKLQTKVTGEK